MATGQEWIVDAQGCAPERLRDPRRLAALFEELVVYLGLKVMGMPQWQVFPSPGGVTGLALLSESHLAIHTFPETGFAALNVYSCRFHPTPDFAEQLRRHLGADRVEVRTLPRGNPTVGAA